MPRPIRILDADGVREELAYLKLSQRDFARKLAMQEAEVSRALHGKPIRPDSVFRLAWGLANLEPVQ